MRNLLEMIYEYQRLRSKEQNLSIDLDDSERVRLMGLHRLLSGERFNAARRDFLRVQLPLPVQFTLPGGFDSGEIRDLSGGGFCIVTLQPPAQGTRLVVRVADPLGGSEYVFPCRVVWRAMRGPARMGVELDGVPHRSAFLSEDTGVWRRTVRFGEPPGEPMVA
jgi:PilZ domain-containing protein